MFSSGIKIDSSSCIGSFFLLRNTLAYFKNVKSLDATITDTIIENISNKNFIIYKYVKENETSFIHNHISEFFVKFIKINCLDEAKELFEIHQTHCEKNNKKNILSTKEFLEKKLRWNYLNYESFLFFIEICPFFFHIITEYNTRNFIATIFDSRYIPRLNIISYKRDEERLKIKYFLIENYPELVKTNFNEIHFRNIAEAMTLLPALYQIGYKVQNIDLFLMIWRPLFQFVDVLTFRRLPPPASRYLETVSEEKIANSKYFVQLIETLDSRGLIELLSQKSSDEKYLTQRLVNRLIYENSELELSDKKKQLVLDLHDFLVEKGAPSGFSNTTKNAAQD